jgi:hypothetical protein
MECAKTDLCIPVHFLQTEKENAEENEKHASYWSASTEEQ